MRRILFVFAVLGSIAACGKLVGVKDLEVLDSIDEARTDDAGGDVELLPDTSAFEVDDGIEVKPPVDAGCEASLYGTFAPTAFATTPGDETYKMKWRGDWTDVRADDGKTYNLSSLAFTNQPTTSKVIKFSGFQTFVPDNRRIVGLAVNITARASFENFFRDSVVRLTAADDATLSANHAIDTVWTKEKTTRTYGGPNTMWELERSLTSPTLLNAEGFGVVYVLSKSNISAFENFLVDQLSLSVYTCP